jgi:hypothetical protein
MWEGSGTSGLKAVRAVGVFRLRVNLTDERC